MTGLTVQADERTRLHASGPPRWRPRRTHAGLSGTGSRDAFGTGGAGAVRTVARKEYATALHVGHRETGAVTAVGGIGHLGPLTEALGRN